MRRQHVSGSTATRRHAGAAISLVLVLGMIATGLMCAAPVLAAPGWATIRVTDNAATDEWPAIDENGDHLVWQHTATGGDSEIYLWNAAKKQADAITSNTTKDRFPKISGDYVAWEGQDVAGDWEIYLHHISTGETTKLTNNATDDIQVQICGDLVVWLAKEPAPVIYAYAISTGTLHVAGTALGGTLEHPQTDGSWVVWQARRATDPGSDLEIEYWDGAVVHQLTANTTDDIFPTISGQEIVWQGQDGHDYEIFHYAGGGILQLTDNSVADEAPLIDTSATGSWVAWRTYAGLDWEVALASVAAGSFSVKQVTSNSAQDHPTDLQGEEVVWYGGAGSTDIYGRLASGEVLNFSESPYEDRYPCVGGSVVVWQGRDEEGDWEIFAALPDNEDPEVAIDAPEDGAVLSGAMGEITGAANDNMAVAEVEIRIDGGPWQTATILSGEGTETASWRCAWNLPAEDNGAGHIIQARGTDTAGNSALSGDRPEVRVDSVGPSVASFLINQDAAQTTSTSVTLTFSVLDGSPPLQMRFSNDGATWSAWEAYAGSKIWSLTAGSGSKTVWGSFRDRYGNVSPEDAISDSIVVPPGGFTDVPAGHQYAEAIYGMRDAGIIEGYPAGDNWEFRPGDPVFRAQFAKMICGVMDIPVEEDDWPDAAVPFTDLGDDLLPGGDTEGNHLYPHEYVAAAYLNQITRGQTVTTFAPYTSITRAQLITMSVRAAHHLRPGTLATPPVGYAGTLGLFDLEHGANLQIAEYNGLLEGLAGFGVSWDPWATATRGEAAQMLWNLVDAME